jgi:hypothetical protein
MEESNIKIEEHKTNNDKSKKGKNNNVKTEKKLLKILMVIFLFYCMQTIH